MRCEAISLALPLLAESPGRIRGVAVHLDSCLRCRRELLRYQRMRDALGQLSHSVVSPPSWLSSQIVERCASSAVFPVDGSRRSIRRITTIAGLAGAAGVIVAANRLRSKTG